MDYKTASTTYFYYPAPPNYLLQPPATLATPEPRNIEPRLTDARTSLRVSHSLTIHPHAPTIFSTWVRGALVTIVILLAMVGFWSMSTVLP